MFALSQGCCAGAVTSMAKTVSKQLSLFRLHTQSSSNYWAMRCETAMLDNAKETFTSSASFTSWATQLFSLAEQKQPNTFVSFNLLELLGERLTDSLAVRPLKWRRSSLLQLQSSRPSDRGQQTEVLKKTFMSGYFCYFYCSQSQPPVIQRFRPPLHQNDPKNVGGYTVNIQLRFLNCEGE